MEFKIVWNVNNPEHPNNNYLCDLGAYGVSLCWWDGETWTKMWTGDKVKVYGWINIPVYISGEKDTGVVFTHPNYHPLK